MLASACFRGEEMEACPGSQGCHVKAGTGTASVSLQILGCSAEHLSAVSLGLFLSRAGR